MSQRTSITSIIALNTKGVATGAAHIHIHLGEMRQKQTNTSWLYYILLYLDDQDMLEYTPSILVGSRSV